MIWRNNKIHLTAQDQTCENQLNEPSREHWVNTTYRNRFFSCWRRRHALFCLHLTSTRHKRNLHTHTETVNLFLFVPCTSFAGGKCQAWKLKLNDCHLFAILLLSREMCKYWYIWWNTQVILYWLTSHEKRGQKLERVCACVDCFCVIVFIL